MEINNTLEDRKKIIHLNKSTDSSNKRREPKKKMKEKCEPNDRNFVIFASMLCIWLVLKTNKHQQKWSEKYDGEKKTAATDQVKLKPTIALRKISTFIWKTYRYAIAWNGIDTTKKEWYIRNITLLHTTSRIVCARARFFTPKHQRNSFVWTKFSMALEYITS